MHVTRVDVSRSVPLYVKMPEMHNQLSQFGTEFNQLGVAGQLGVATVRLIGTF
jgi:hypothetical protein